MLDVSRIVRVTVNLTQAPAAARSFTTLMIAGDSPVITGLQRYRTYTNITDVANDFGTTAPEYLAASLYFGQSPQPKKLLIGRWLRVATAAQNLGGILSPSQQAISNFNAITNGGFDITVDGVAKTPTGIDFSACTNLNGVASAINLVLTGAVCSWNGSEFVITSNSTGAGSYANGTITFNSNPANADTVTIGGTAIEFVTSGATGAEVNIGTSAAATAANLMAFLVASSDTQLVKCNYSFIGSPTPIITLTYKTLGATGNSFTLAKSSTALAVSGADLTGGAVPSSVGYATAGTGTDISALLQLTASTAVALVPGYAAESALQCVNALAGKTTAWYGLMFAASVMPVDADNLAIAAYIEALVVTRMFGITIQNTNVLSPLVTNDLASFLMAGNYDQTFSQYCSSNPYVVASLFGRAFGIDFSQQNSTITLMFKQEPGVVAEDLSESDADSLEAKRCNVFTVYDNNTSILQYGVMAGPTYIDESQGIDWFQNNVQTQVYNTLYTSGKVAQTDAGQNQLANAAGNACDDAVFNGFAAPGIWNGPSFGSLQTGQYLKSGFYVFAQSIDTQSESDRAARKAPPMQIALKEAGAFHGADILVTVNQ